MNIPYVMRKCTKCGRWLVASTNNFRRKKGGKYGLQAECKECAKKRHKLWCEANREKYLERQRRYYEANRKKEAEYKKQWYEANRDKILEYQKQYYQDNKGKVLKRQKQYYEANRDKRAEQHKRYHQSPKGQVASFNGQQKRRIKEGQQGIGITKKQWLEMMNFFDFRCAYSGETLTKDTRSIDHIVPLNSNGDNMIWNCVPMLRSLNSSKCAKDMLEWYKEQDFYSEARLAKIYEWQEYARKKWKNS